MTSSAYSDTQTSLLTGSAELKRQIDEVVCASPVVDMHTHLFPAEFDEMSLSGIDELLNYHYLIAETFRSSAISPESFWQMTRPAQADLIWKTLFVENTPLSEATRGVITVLRHFGLDANAPDLTEARAFFATRDPHDHLDQVFDLAGVRGVVMTNDPFDPRETALWESGSAVDPRFHAALRMDRLLNGWQSAVAALRSLGYDVDEQATGASVSEVRRFLDKWIHRMNPLYMAVSLPDDFSFPDGDLRDRMIREVVLPTALQYRLPFAMMVGVRRAVNPALRGGGDGVGKADIRSLERICAENPDVRFMATYLSRENQHELCVVARKFSNLLPFGCWWFLNTPSIVSEITRERIELLGTSFVPQHSDARILEQLIYKWEHARRVIAESLHESYSALLAAGRAVSRREIERDVARLFTGNFGEWAGLTRVGSVAE